MSAILSRLSTRTAIKCKVTYSLVRNSKPQGTNDLMLTCLRASSHSCMAGNIGGNHNNMYVPIRMFSTESPSSDLAEILEREMDEEVNAGSTAMPPELASLKAKIEKEWRIVDDGATAKLFRKDAVSGAKVAISVHCQDTVDDAAADDDGEEEERSPPLRFTVAITKAGKTLVLTCLSEDAEAYVESTAVSSQDIEAILNSGVASSNYQGPAFPELAEDLQEAFHTYMRSLVNEDVAAFLPMYADYLEQQQYVQFLKQAQSIL